MLPGNLLRCWGFFIGANMGDNKDYRRKVADSFRILTDAGMCVHVPGCFDICDVDAAVLFATDRDAFYEPYRKQEEEERIRYGLSIARKKEAKKEKKKTYRKGYVYAILDHANHAVKIGFSKDPSKRLAHFQCSSPSQLELVGQMPCSQLHEQKLHTKLAHARLSGEWFDYSDDKVIFEVNKIILSGEEND